MLEHADREDRIERFVQFAVVLQTDLDRQTGAQFARELGLLLRNGHANATDTVALGGELQGFAPATTDIQHTLPRAQAQLAADQVKLGFLRGVEIVGIAPVAAAVHQALTEHGLVEIVAEVVVAAAHLVAALPHLQVEQARLQCIGHFAPAVHPFVQVRLHQVDEEFIQDVGVPPTVHVAFAEAERAVRHDPREEARVMHLDILWLGTADADPGFLQQAGDPLLQPCIHATSSTTVNRVRTAPRSPWPRAATAPPPVHRRSGYRPSMDPPGTAGKQSAAP